MNYSLKTINGLLSISIASFEICPCCCMCWQFVPSRSWVLFHCLDAPAEGHFDCFCVLVIMNNAAVTVHEEVVVCTNVFISLGQIPGSGSPTSYVRACFVRNQQAVFQGGCIMWRSHQQCRRVLVPPHAYQHLVSSGL